MTNRLELNWKVDGFVDEQRYYCSENPIDTNAPPTPVAILSSSDRTHIEHGLTLGKYYYIRISAYKNGVEKFSDEKRVLFGKMWLPINIDSLKCCIESESTVVNSSNVVSSLNDLTSNNYNFSQLSEPSRPTLIENRVKFDGNNDFVAINSSLADIYQSKQRMFLFFALRGGVSSGSVKPVFITTFGVDSTRIGLHQINETQMRFSLRSTSSDTLQSLVFSYSSNEDMVLYFDADLITKKARVFKNGDLITTVDLTTSLTAFANVSNVLYPQIGNGGGGVTAWDGSLYSFATSDQVLTDADRQKLEGWAAHKYGLIGNLPSGHPYKILAPTL